MENLTKRFVQVCRYPTVFVDPVQIAAVAYENEAVLKNLAGNQTIYMRSGHVYQTDAGKGHALREMWGKAQILDLASKPEGRKETQIMVAHEALVGFENVRQSGKPMLNIALQGGHNIKVKCSMAYIRKTFGIPQPC